MNQPKRKLEINMIGLEAAFEHHDELMETSYFLDLETGEVVMTTGEERRLLEEIYEQYGDPETGEVDWPTVLPQLDVPDWQKKNPACGRSGRGRLRYALHRHPPG